MDYSVDSFSPRKLAGIAFVALLYVAILYALINGLGTQAVHIFQQPLEVKIIQPVKPQVMAPPPPLVQIAQPPPVPVIAAVMQVKPAAPAPRPAPVFDPNQTCKASVTLQNDLGQDENADAAG